MRKTMHTAFGRRGLVQISLAAVLAIGAAIAVSGALEGGAAEFDQGARLASICAACHDADGRSDGIPPLTGLDENEITEALARYRASESPSIVMHAIALALTEEEVRSVARYLASKGKEARP
jgi:sulfide dehydrogenase cytochrome subunit